MDRRQALKKVFRALREGRTQKEIAQTADLPESKVSLYAKGRQYPISNNLAKLAKGLGCYPEQLERAIVLVQVEPELGDNPSKLRARIGLAYVPGDAPRQVPAAEAMGTRDPSLHEIVEHVSRVEEEIKSIEEEMRSIKHKLIRLSTRVPPPSPPPEQDLMMPESHSEQD